MEEIDGTSRASLQPQPRTETEMQYSLVPKSCTMEFRQTEKPTKSWKCIQGLPDYASVAVAVACNRSYSKYHYYNDPFGGEACVPGQVEDTG